MRVLPFSKLEALGNDFMLVDARDRRFAPDRSTIRRWGDRRLGVGFDQLLILRPGDDTHACRVEIRNRDGSEAEQCGNGMRAVALWLGRAGDDASGFRLATAAGTVEARRVGQGQFSATLGKPRFEPAAIGLADVSRFPWELEIDGETHSVHGVSLGNPHLLLLEPETPDAGRLERLGQVLGRHPSLARGANVGVAKLRSRGEIELRVFERGAGPTRACGSGAAAAAVILISLGQVDSPVEVHQPGGKLVVNWSEKGSEVAIAGPAHHVFEGVLPWPIDPC